MKLKTILAAAILFLSIPSFGQSNITETTLEVDGLCGMCKKRIENAAYIQGVKKSKLGFINARISDYLPQ